MSLNALELLGINYIAPRMDYIRGYVGVLEWIVESL